MIWMFRPSVRSERPRTALLRAFEVFAFFSSFWKKLGLGSSLSPPKCKNFPLLFCFCFEKTGKGMNKKHKKIKGSLFFVLSVYKQQEMELEKSTRKLKLRLFHILNIWGNQTPMKSSCLNIVLQVKPLVPLVPSDFGSLNYVTICL